MVNVPTEGASGGPAPTPPPVPEASYATGTGGSSGGTGSRAAARDARTAAQNAAAIADASGTNLITNDASGFGLDRPYLEWNAYQTALEASPPVNTVSGSFQSLWTLSSEPQHPKLRVRVLVVCGASTSGEVRLTDRVTGTVISSILVVGSGATVEANLDGTLLNPSLFGAGAPMKVDVQARRTAGANAVAVLVVHAVGKGT